MNHSFFRREILHTEPRVTRFKINWTNSGDKYSIADTVVEQNQNIGSGMTAEQLMMGEQDENRPPNADLIRNAAQGTYLGGKGRLEGILTGMQNEDSMGPGGFGTSHFKAGHGVEAYETSIE